LPDAAFRANPARALWFLPLLAFAGVSVGVVASGRFGIAGAVVAIPIAGSAYASMLLLAHEVMHGAIVRSRCAQYWLAWIGFAPFLISPSLWRVWHNELHHGFTNRADRDPDVFADAQAYASSPMSRFVVRLVPGSGTPASLLFPFFWFAAQGQIVLWFLSTKMPGFEKFNRPRAAVESGAMLAGWCGLAFALGGASGAVAVVLPLAVGNAVLMSYIATNHLMRPLADDDKNPLATSMSVRTPGAIDRAHFRFSHHVEHHLLPSVSGRYLPRVRTWLLENEPDRFLCVDHWRAVAWLYRTPRTYRDDRTLVDPTRPERQAVDLDQLEIRLRRRAPLPTTIGGGLAAGRSEV
jgi:fatty acid desaturase